MRGTIETLTLMACLSLAYGQNVPRTVTKPAPLHPPAYTISFRLGQPIDGVGSVLAMRLPFECTSDGTVFITTVQPNGVGGRPRNLAQFAPSMLVMSISISGIAHSFPLNEVDDLYDINDIGLYVSDSKVIFLLRAAQGSSSVQLDTQNTSTRSFPEYHFYAVIFDRDGRYQKTLQLGDDFQVSQLGLFPTGQYLAYGYDKNDHSPRLAILKEDGGILEYLQINKNDIPRSAVDSLNGSGPAVRIAPIQFIGRDHSIYILQNKTNFPLLEVSESGTIRKINPQLGTDDRIQMLIPSDSNFYARTAKESIYEFDESGAAMLLLR
jgi:hypothetical protein